MFNNIKHAETPATTQKGIATATQNVTTNKVKVTEITNAETVKGLLANALGTAPNYLCADTPETHPAFISNAQRKPVKANGEAKAGRYIDDLFVNGIIHNKAVAIGVKSNLLSSLLPAQVPTSTHKPCYAPAISADGKFLLNEKGKYAPVTQMLPLDAYYEFLYLVYIFNEINGFVDMYLSDIKFAPEAPKTSLLIKALLNEPNYDYDYTATEPRQTVTNILEILTSKLFAGKDMDTERALYANIKENVGDLLAKDGYLVDTINYLIVKVDVTPAPATETTQATETASDNGDTAEFTEEDFTELAELLADVKALKGENAEAPTTPPQSHEVPETPATETPATVASTHTKRNRR